MTLTLATLPALGTALEGGIFAGITTQPDGTHVAVALLPDKGKDLTWKQATAWAKKLGAQLPTRPIAALLFANVKAQLDPRWHWTADEEDASYAWSCHFNYGTQDTNHKSAGGCAVAVRLIPLTA